MTSPHSRVARARRGLLAAGDKVQLTDPKGRFHTIVLKAGATFHTHRGQFSHDDIIGQPDGSVVTTTVGTNYLVLRPLITDYVMSMPRGAAVIYPKDSAQIVHMADIFPGATVVEAGVGSGALTLALLRAVGESGQVISLERREDFADIARLNVEGFFGGPVPAWHLAVGDFADRAGDMVAQVTGGEHAADAVVLDMLAPWENVDSAYDCLEAGGVLLCYVATVTQLSRVVETMRDHGGFTEPQSSETMVRSWHLEGLAVRPDHRMIAHTGFLVVARRLADGVTAPVRHRRPAKGAYEHDVSDGAWSAADLGERPVSDKKVRTVKRRAVREAGTAGEDAGHE